MWALAPMKVPWVIFPHASKASTFWAILVSCGKSSLKTLRQASTVEKADLVCASSFTGPPRQKKSCMDSKNSLWHQQDSAIEAYLAMSSASAVRLSPSVQKQKLKLELLRGSRLKLDSLPVSVVVHEHLVRAGCMFFGTATRRTLTRLHRRSIDDVSHWLCKERLSVQRNLLLQKWHKWHSSHLQRQRKASEKCKQMKERAAQPDLNHATAAPCQNRHGRVHLSPGQICNHNFLFFFFFFFGLVNHNFLCVSARAPSFRLSPSPKSKNVLSADDRISFREHHGQVLFLEARRSLDQQNGGRDVEFLFRFHRDGSKHFMIKLQNWAVLGRKGI